MKKVFYVAIWTREFETSIITKVRAKDSEHAFHIALELAKEEVFIHITKLSICDEKGFILHQKMFE